MESGKTYFEERSQDTSHAINLKQFVDPDQTGDELKISLSDEGMHIVVIMWFNNLYNHWSQNRLNQEARGTLQSILKSYHKDVIYHEADLSNYNLNAYTYLELAKELGINVIDLEYGPIAVVMYDQRGSSFVSQKGTFPLVSAVDREIHKMEKEIFNRDLLPCNIDVEIEAMNQYKMYEPWKDYEQYQPNKDESNHDKHTQKSVAAKLIDMNRYTDNISERIAALDNKPVVEAAKFNLKEPDKAFSVRRRRRR